jgi:hypothetical protein
VLLPLAAADPGDQFPPLPLQAFTVGRARELHGSTVTALGRVDKPPLTWDGLTLIGTAGPGDGTERGAVLTGERFDIRQGGRLVVTGRLLAIDHPTSTINGTAFPGFTAIRVETRRARLQGRGVPGQVLQGQPMGYFFGSRYGFSSR